MNLAGQSTRVTSSKGMFTTIPYSQPWELNDNFTEKSTLMATSTKENSTAISMSTSLNYSLSWVNRPTSRPQHLSKNETLTTIQFSTPMKSDNRLTKGSKSTTHLSQLRL